MMQIPELIANNQTEKALDLLQIFAKEKNNNDLENDLLLLYARYNRWEDDNRRGLNPPLEELIRIQQSILKIDSSLPRKPNNGKNLDGLVKATSTFFYSWKGVLLTIGLILLIIYCFNFLWKPEPEFIYSNLDEQLTEFVTDDILRLDYDFGDTYEHNKPGNEIIKNAELLLQDIDKFENDQINIQSRIYKNFAVALCHKVIFLTTSNKNVQNIHADQGIMHSKAGLLLITQVRAYDNMKLKQYILKNLISDYMEEHLSFTLFLSAYIKKSNGDNTISASYVESLFAKVNSNDFLEKEHYINYPLVKEYISSSSQKNNL